MHALVAEAVQQEDEHETAEEQCDHERGDRTERVDVVGARELDPPPQRVAKASPFDERRGCAEREESKERKRDQVAAGHDGDASDAEREKRDTRDRERGTDVLVRREREPARADVCRRPQQRPNRRDERPGECVRQRHQSDAGERGSDPERE